MMSTFHSVVNVHIISAVVSIVGFVWRWQLALKNSPVLQHKLVKIAPHIVDTILLGSGIWLSVMIGEYPLVQGWLTAKLLLLVVYIGLGTVAIKRAKNNRQRFFCGLCAIAVFAGIAWIAYHH